MDHLSSPLDAFFPTAGGMGLSTLKSRIRVAATRQMITSQAELGRRMGVNRQTVNRWWNGEGDRPEPEMLVLLADALNVSIRWLATGKGSMNRDESLTIPEAETLAIYRALAHNPGAAEKWLRHGRELVEILAPPGVANPFGKNHAP